MIGSHHLGDRLLNRWLRFRASFWFVPGVMTTLAVALSFVTIGVDEAADWDISSTSFVGYPGRPDGARALLAAIASSTITVAATAFSVTIAALALASSQFGSRLLRNFISDTANQVVLGTFIGTFAYCMLVLRTVNGTEGAEFVPQISITVAMAMAMASLGVLIYFIHHVATSIQATSIVASVARDLEASVMRLLAGEERLPAVGERPREGVLAEVFDEREAGHVALVRSGYIQTIDRGRLLRMAKRRDVTVRLHNRAGQFLLPGAVVASVWPGGAVDEGLKRELDGAFMLGKDRTPTQDVEYAMDQLAEIAVRALSPGINDPFTALNCVDRLGSAMSLIAGRGMPEPFVYDEEGNLRVIAVKQSYASIADVAFNLIRQHARGNAPVLMRLLETIAVLAWRTASEEQREVLLRHAKMIQRAAESLPEENDREDMNERYRYVVQALQEVRLAEEKDKEMAG
jgi:uncharacterized membrane protein